MKLIYLPAVRTALFSGAVMSMLLIPLLAKAQSGSENAALFTSFGQGNSSIVSASGQSIANMACVPTATAMGLSYLQNYQLSLGHANPLTFTTSYLH